MLKYIIIPLLLIACSSDNVRTFKEPYEELIANAYKVYLRQSSSTVYRMFKDNENYLNSIPLTTLLKQVSYEYRHRLTNNEDSLVEIVACKEVTAALLKSKYGFFQLSDHLETDIYTNCYYGDITSILEIINFTDEL